MIRYGSTLLMALLLVGYMRLPAWARDDCSDPLFICESSIRDKYIEICAVEEEVGRRWSHIQYRFGTIDHPDFVYPADASKGATSLFFSHEYLKNGDYQVTVRFTNKGYTYRVFSIADDTGMKGGAGVRVSDAKGKELSVIACIERPYIFPTYLRRALSCDLANPHGRAACGDKPYRR